MKELFGLNYTATDIYFAVKKFDLPDLSNLIKELEEWDKKISPLAKNNSKSKKQFVDFHRIFLRFKVHLNAKISFEHEGDPKNTFTISCYEMMMKMSDLWFIFEALKENAKKSGNDLGFKNRKSHCDFLGDNPIERLKLNNISIHFTKILSNMKEKDKTEILKILDTLSKKARNTTIKERINEIPNIVNEGEELKCSHIFSISYCLRNIYAHSGKGASLGSDNYKVTSNFYLFSYLSLIYFTLIISNDLGRILSKKS